ncbi:MAG: serine esterase [Sulfurovum sp.]|uniref:alpha/beta hydrolase n=1 Tax=Sulfurovum sp. TaxID=1969726 RepID=UPI00286808CD|nr:alpha/beta fold hydrolase [Sulfurovum sp.]MCO4845239.1 serine esterase [Sulfurovum sp.]
MQSREDLQLNNIFIPSKVASKKLMIILHGRGDSSRGFTFLPSYLNIDDMNYLLLDAPYYYYGGFSWYDLAPNQWEGIVYSSGILADTLDTLFEEEFNADESFLFGFSQGALLTFEFGSRYEKVLAGYIAVSGYIYDTNNLLHEMNPNVNTSNWLCTHGTSDGILPFNTSKVQVETLQNGGFDITFKSYDKDHNVVEDELMMIKEWIKNKL